MQPITIPMIMRVAIRITFRITHRPNIYSLIASFRGVSFAALI